MKSHDVSLLFILIFPHRQEIVEEERIKIIQEHAEALLGFLPAGVLRETDRKYLPMRP